MSDTLYAYVDASVDEENGVTVVSLAVRESVGGEIVWTDSERINDEYGSTEAEMIAVLKGVRKTLVKFDPSRLGVFTDNDSVAFCLDPDQPRDIEHFEDASWNQMMRTYRGKVQSLLNEKCELWHVRPIPRDSNKLAHSITHQRLARYRAHQDELFSDWQLVASARGEGHLY